MQIRVVVGLASDAFGAASGRSRHDEDVILPSSHLIPGSAAAHLASSTALPRTYPNAASDSSRLVTGSEQTRTPRTDYESDGPEWVGREPREVTDGAGADDAIGQPSADRLRGDRHGDRPEHQSDARAPHRGGWTCDP